MSSLVLDGIGIVLGLVAIWYARRSAISARRSAKAAERSAGAAERRANAAETALDLTRDQRVSAVVKEALDGWKIHGSLGPFLDRHSDLTLDEQDEVARRVYLARGKAEEVGLKAAAKWRNARSRKGEL